MKRLFSSVFAALLCTSMLAGCASAPSSEASSGASSAAAPSSEASPSEDAGTSSGAADSAQQDGQGTLPEKFVLGLDASFPPMGFMNEKNEIIGADIDIAKAVCEKLGMEFEAKPIAWDAKEMELNTDKITCIWNGLTIDDDRKEAFELSRPYMKNEQVIVVMNDSTIQAKGDLAGKVVAAQTDSSGLFALQADEILASIDGGAAKEYADYVTALTDLEIGRCDAIVMDSTVANYYIKQGKSIRLLEEKMTAEEYGIAFKKGQTELLAAVEKAMAELAEEGKIAEISNTWFGRDDMIITYPE